MVDKVEENEGEEEEKIDTGVDQSKTNSIIKKAEDYLNGFEGNIPPEKQEEYDFITALLQQ